MPRRRHRGGSNAAAVPDGEVDGQGERVERIAVFQRTKMCKFHILGVCSKGQTCRFAHDRSELQALPDLQRTKLCKTLISTGECTNPACRYAHNKEELRPLPAASHSDAPLAESMPDTDLIARCTVLQQAAFGSAMQAALVQVGQAAQAHAAEAARLQALAAQLQMGALPLCGTEQIFSGFHGPSGMPRDPKAAGETGGSGVWASAMNRVAPHCTSPAPGDEPVQILPETLRSLSSSSLSLLAGGLDDDDVPMTPEANSPMRAAGCQAPWRQGQLLGSVAEEHRLENNSQVESPVPETEQGLKAHRSKEHSVGGLPDPSSSSSPLAPTLKGGLDYEYDLNQQGGHRSSEDGEEHLSETNADEDDRRRHSSSMEGSLVDLSASGITVKNTFLDFVQREPTTGLRAVQTAAGRLDLMWEE